MSDQEIDKIAAQLQHAAPAAWDTTQRVAQIDAIAYLVPAFISAVLLGIIALVLLRRGLAIMKDKDACYDAETPYMISGALVSLGAIVGLGILLFSPWAWITAFDPALGSAHLVLHRLIGT